MPNIDNAKRLLKVKPKKIILPSDYLSTGSTQLNLACSGKYHGGFIKGHYYFLVGDSNSGKTFIALTCFAEACQNEAFDDYELIFDDAEDGALMDFEKFFGKRVAKRVKAPRHAADGTPIYSSTIQDLYYNLDDAKNRGKPFIYVIDSMDALSSEQEQEKVKEQKVAYRKKMDEGKTVKITGSFGDGKAKVNSSNFRQIVPYLRESGSILIIIAQTRDNLVPMSYEKKTRSGGKALTFYATLEMWSSQAGHIMSGLINGKKRELGILSKIRVKKNRIQGKDRTVTIPLYHSFGIDDIGSCVDYLVEEKHWSCSKTSVITAEELDFIGKKGKLIKHIEDNNLQSELQMLVAEVWNSIEEQCVIKRKKRYE